MRFIDVVLLSSLFLVAVHAPAAQEPASKAEARRPAEHRPYFTQRWSGTSPVIDGRLDEPGWTTGSWLTSFTQREPNEGAQASLPTFVKIFFDDKNLYVAFRCMDPKVATRPRLLAAPDEFAGDMVGIALDTYFNRRSAFEFNVTSGGSKVDAVLGNFTWSDTSWRAVWECKVGLEPDAWVAEYRIPLSQLRYSPAAKQVWGLHLWRWIDENQEESQYSLIPLDHNGVVRSFGELHGIESLPKHRRLEIVPYAVVNYQTHGPEADNPLSKRRESKWNGGLDAKYGLTSDLTLDATINPDFGQVEADPSEINLSTVERFLSEQRPFFIEGKTVFDFKIEDDNVFYSRRIGAPPTLETPDAAFAERPGESRVLGSAKITGRTEHGLTLGALAATTDRTYANLSDGKSTTRALINPLTHYYATRLQQDLQGGDLVVGGILAGVTRVGADDELRDLPRQAVTGGVEATRYWGGHSYFVDGRFLATRLQGSRNAVTEKMQEWVHNYQRVDAEHLEVDAQAETLSGHAGTLRAGKENSGLWRYQAAVTWRSPGLDLNDIGYLAQADSISPLLRIDYFDTNVGAHLKRRLHSLRVRETRDFDRLLTGRSVFLVSEISTNNNQFFWTQIGTRFNRLDTRILRGGPALRLPENATASMQYDGDASKRWVPHAWFDWTRSLGSKGSYLQMEPSVTYRPAANTSLKCGLEVTLNRQDYQYAASSDFGAESGWVMGRLRQNTVASTLRLTHNFSPALTFTYYAGPYITSGKFSQFKRVIAPRAGLLEARYRDLTPMSLGDDVVGVDADRPYRFENPNFTWRELKSNLVLRWEYRPGSFLYCVWSQQRSDGTEDLQFRAVDEHRRLFSARPENVFLVKASYWFSI